MPIMSWILHFNHALARVTRCWHSWHYSTFPLRLWCSQLFSKSLAVAHPYRRADVHSLTREMPLPIQKIRYETIIKRAPFQVWIYALTIRHAPFQDSRRFLKAAFVPFQDFLFARHLWRPRPSTYCCRTEDSQRFDGVSVFHCQWFAGVPYQSMASVYRELRNAKRFDELKQYFDSFSA